MAFPGSFWIYPPACEARCWRPSKKSRDYRSHNRLQNSHRNDCGVALVIFAVALLAGMQADSTVLARGVRTPAYAADGRLAVALSGDIWIIGPVAEGESTPARQVTRGPAWDQDPAWSADGRSIVFASDQSGTLDLWRVAVGVGAGTATPERLTSSPEEDEEPAVGVDGSIVFVRGRAGDTDLWLRDESGGLHRLTSTPGAEREPALSPDGGRVAYIAIRQGRRVLCIRTLADSTERTMERAAGASHPAWSPDGRRLVYATGGRTPGLWVMGEDGSYLQEVSTRGGVAAWSPDGGWIAVAEESPPDVGYNGDPDRLGERSAGDQLSPAGGLRLLPAPLPPDSGGAVVQLTAAVERRARNATAYDRVWSRLARLYYGGRGGVVGPTGAAPGGESEILARWRQLGNRQRPVALAAADDDQLADAIYALIRARPPVRAEAVGRAAISSAHPAATAAGLEILRKGGNVVDAAVAVSFALGVVEPDASGPGGYGEMLIYRKGMAEPVAIEFMTRVPEAATLDNPALRAAVLPRTGPAVANVPGTVAGMDLAWRRYGSGRVSWQEILAPAIRLAENGWVVTDALATTLREEREAFEEYPGSRRLFFPGGKPRMAGDTLRNPDLAWTLRQIADSGAAAFYQGAPARRLVTDLRAHGNTITLEDMKRYFAVERRPVHTTYRGNAVYSGPPPVTGGATLAAKLNLLENRPAGSSYTDDPAELHALLEAWLLQPSTANRIADPDLWPVDITPFESKDTARARWRCFDPEQQTTVRAGGGGGDPCASTGPPGGSREGDELAGGAERSSSAEPCEGSRDGTGSCRATGTTAFAVADADGNAVAVTQTLGTWGGNFYVTPGLGFLYNDKLRSYRTDPAAYGARLPYARNSTVIAPTLIFRGSGDRQQLWAAVGAAGNSWITSAVYALVVGIVDHGLGPQQALELPRFLPGGRGPRGAPIVQVEEAFSPAALRALEKMGHRFRPISFLGELRMGYGAAVVVGDGVVRAGADPRRSGAAGAVH